MATTAAVYAQIKASAAATGSCQRQGCSAQALEDSDWCEAHRDAERARKAKWIAKRRRKRRRQKLCEDCGVPLRRRVLPSGRVEWIERIWCRADRAKRDRLSAEHKRQGVDGNVDKSDRIAAAIRVDPTGRTRYHGQQKRGNQPHAQLDAQDQETAQRHIAAGFERLSAYRTPEVQGMPRIQRESVRLQALHEIDLGTRFLDDVLERNGHFKLRHGKRDGE